MSKVIIVANWKNHPTSLEEAQGLVKTLLKKRLLYKKFSLFIAPPLPYLEVVSRNIRSFGSLAVQDLFVGEKANFTGETTIDILKSFGVKLAILGHSERRAKGETSEMISQKIRLALRSGIIPLICFGEKERDAEGEYLSSLREQLTASLATLSAKELKKIALAYEPVWAIGKTADEALDARSLSETFLFIRKILSDAFGRKIAEGVPILYGGSVEPGNAKELIESGVAGFLVGHASLKAKSFEEIARALFEK